MGKKFIIQKKKHKLQFAIFREKSLKSLKTRENYELVIHD